MAANSLYNYKCEAVSVSPESRFPSTGITVSASPEWRCFYAGIITTNAIESLNATYRKLNHQRSVFPSSQALLKALYLATFEATKKWSMPIRNWGLVYGELAIMYEGRLPD